MRRLVERVRGLVLQPRHTLPMTLADAGELRAVAPMVALLAALGPLALLVSDGLVGAYYPPTTTFNQITPGRWVRAPGPALREAIIAYLVGAGAWLALSSVLRLLAPRFGALADDRGAHKAAACMLTPVWLAGALFVLGSVPYLGFLALVALAGGVAYAVFLGTLALPLHLAAPDGRAPGFALAALGVTAVAVTVVYQLLTLVLGWIT